MNKTRRIVFAGILLALACGISFLESSIPLPLPLGAKPGIASIVVMFSFMRLDIKTASAITVLKSLFVFITRGATAFLMSISGGVLSLAIMLLLYRFTKSSIVMVSISGAIIHNIAQLTAVGFLTGSFTAVIAYSPALIITGCITGSFTGLVLGIVLNRLDKINIGGLSKK